ncbi:MAG: FAD:protein FMN transferase [Desulfuromonadales bacterium]|nr:FAD:protein FMN transferase [Desulfuromonadales bacterium]
MLSRARILGLIAILLLLAWWRLPSTQDELRRSRLVMGTVVEIVASGDATQGLDVAVSAAFDEMERVERLLSRYIADSELSRLSQQAGPFTLSDEAAAVIALGLDVAKRSDGAFDLTLGRLNDLWAIDSASPKLPTPAQLAEAMRGIGPEALLLNGQTLKKRSAALELDLGGIAKGYAVDRAIAVLKQHGVASAAVNAGGDMYLLGELHGRSWRIGIQHPRQTNASLETVQVSNRAVVTSGDYERFFEQEGQRYHHLFDPKSGLPARGCRSVTVIADSVALADALATAVFVLGPRAGAELLHNYPDAEGLIVAADGTLSSSAGWVNYQAAP